MAEAIILSPLVQVILDNATFLIEEHIGTISGAKKDLKKLSETMELINAVLRDAEEKQVNNAAVRTWLRQLKDAAFDADDILDEWATEALRRKIQGTPRTHGRKVRNFLFPCFCLSKVVFLHGIGNKIKEMRERLQEIANERSNFGLKLGAAERMVEIRETGSFVKESNILGRDDDREKLVNLLVSDEDGREDLSVIPIVGIGGMGKTTLAQYVYNDERVKKCFKPRMWVCVSEDFEEKSLISRIMKSATRKSGESLDLDQLQLGLCEQLSGTKFLLVLDDIWNEDLEKWKKLKDLLSFGARRSKIIVTTRSEKISSIMGTTPAIQLKGLLEDDCWSLFMTHALGEGNEELHPDLIPIGKEIMKKCKGVPLVAKTLGSLMRFKRNKNEWLNVKESEIWNLPEENGILNSLKLSYNHLPYHLKQCFAYCAIFPKDYEIKKKVLIQLWMAEGFIQPSTGGQEMEDIGNEYFNGLWLRSFFQDVKEDDYDVTCRMHDLIHDLAQSIAGDDCSIIEDGKLAIKPEKVRYLSVVHERDINIPDIIYRSKKLRTFLHPTVPSLSDLKVSNSLFKKLTHLRVLDLSNSNIRVLPESVGNLKHLRFLDLSRTDIESLPKSTCKLWNLQTLALRRCYSFSKFPKGMKSMINLRHIEMDSDCDGLRCMPIEIGKLTCLQTLPLFIVGKKSGRKIGELKDLKNLGGKIRIQNLENVVDMEDAKEANLKNKQHLHSLELCWTFNIDDFNGQVEEGVLESLQPHNNLRDLSIQNYRGTKFPTWMMNLSLTNNLVKKVSLKNCRKCNHLPPFGRLPFLKELRISGMDEIKDLSSDGFYGQGNEETEFPKLEILRLEKMPKLVDWCRVGEERKLNHLLDLYIEGCPNLRSLPRLPSSLIKLELCKCEVPIPTFLPHLTNLSSLKISGFKDLTPFQEGFRQLSALKSLIIEGSDELVSMEHLTSLEDLYITGCANQTSLHLLPTKLRRLEIEGFVELTSVSEVLQNLTALQILKISRCPKLTLLPEETMQHLTSLKYLLLYNPANLTCLLEGAQHLTSLKCIWIEDCPDLSSLPECIGNLSSSLKRLDIWRCPKLRCLPDTLQHLTTLESLFIGDCPLLKESCKRGGKDWHKISHIPRLDIC